MPPQFRGALVVASDWLVLPIKDAVRVCSLSLSLSRAPRPFELLNYYFSFVSCTVSLKMPNFGDTAQENTTGVSDGDIWPVVFLFVWLVFFCGFE